jgi:hypothetical protein
MAHLDLENDTIVQKDIENVTDVLLDLLNVIPGKEFKRVQNQAFVLENFEQFLIKLMTHDVLPTKEERFKVITFLHKIQSRREAIALMRGELDIEEIKKASENLGKKWTVPENEPFGVSVSKR